ncbi:hypothetical protein SEVIR_9G483501v4 [Setaria viridis]
MVISHAHNFFHAIAAPLHAAAAHPAELECVCVNSSDACRCRGGRHCTVSWCGTVVPIRFGSMIRLKSAAHEGKFHASSSPMRVSSGVAASQRCLPLLLQPRPDELILPREVSGRMERNGGDPPMDGRRWLTRPPRPTQAAAGEVAVGSSSLCCRYASVAWLPISVSLSPSPSRAHAPGDAREVGGSDAGVARVSISSFLSPPRGGIGRGPASPAGRAHAVPAK